MAKPKVTIVTGANRGIGLAICEILLREHSPITLYACSRSGTNLNLHSGDSQSTIHYPTLDITQPSQIASLASRVKSTADGQVDILINNAGVNRYSDTPSDAEYTFNTNYHGTRAMCTAFMPLMAPHGRVVNVSSTASSLDMYSGAIQARFRAKDIELEDVDALGEEYLDAVRKGKLQGWGDAKGYCFSKACINAMTAVLARENPGVTVNACCPGWVDTDTGRIVGQPPKSPEEGAIIPLRLACEDLEGVSGRYWANESVVGRGNGRVVKW